MSSPTRWLCSALWALALTNLALSRVCNRGPFWLLRPPFPCRVIFRFPAAVPLPIPCPSLSSFLLWWLSSAGASLSTLSRVFSLAGFPCLLFVCRWPPWALLLPGALLFCRCPAFSFSPHVCVDSPGFTLVTHLLPGYQPLPLLEFFSSPL